MPPAAPKLALAPEGVPVIQPAAVTTSPLPAVAQNGNATKAASAYPTLHKVLLLIIQSPAPASVYPLRSGAGTAAALGARNELRGFSGIRAPFWTTNQQSQ